MDQNGIVISLLINVVIFFLLLYTADKRYWYVYFINKLFFPPSIFF
jgi:hypothetical protein